MERFIFHHSKLYRQILSVCLILTLTGGLHSVLASSNEEKKSSLFTPPKPVAQVSVPVRQAASQSQTTTTQTQDKGLPEGWEDIEQLPGRDGSGPVTQPAAPTTTASSPVSGNDDPRTLGRSLNAAEFGDQHWPSLLALWNRESNWNPSARNSSSGACGIPQALPCSKIKDMSVQGQLEWGLGYIKSRYGNPSNAWQFWLRNGWY